MSAVIAMFAADGKIIDWATGVTTPISGIGLIDFALILTLFIGILVAPLAAGEFALLIFTSIRGRASSDTAD